MFPWLGFALLGTALGGLWEGQRLLRIAPWMGWAVLAVGVPLWAADPGPQAVRCGYSELFYPPVPGFLVTAVGAVLVLLGAARGLWELGAGRWLATIGRCSLLLYLVHLLAIRGLAVWVDERLPLGPFLLLCGLILAGLLIVAQLVDLLKRRCREQGVRLPGVAMVLLGA
jgi:peptidoglycan/LPS O-acetylase OafA/YrhL